MKKNITIIVSLLSSFATTGAQSHIVVSGNGYEDKIDLSAVDTVYDKGGVRHIDLSFPMRDVDRIRFPKGDEVDLSAENRATDGNRMERFYFTSLSNPEGLVADVEGVIDGNTVSVFLPYVVDFHSLKPSFQTKGRVFVDGEIQKSGVSAQDFGAQREYKVLSSTGDVAVYRVNVYNSGLPVVRVDDPANGKSLDDWTVASPYAAEVEYQSSSNVYGRASVKRKGSRYQEGRKVNFSMKLESKASLLEMSKGKRWVALSCQKDRSLMRSYAGFALASRCESLAWTPAAKHVEWVVGRKHLGTYLFCEQIRVQDGRVSAGSIWEVTDDASADDATFKSPLSGLTFSSEDPEFSEGSSDFSAAVKSVTDFETALYGDNFRDAHSGYRRYADVNSFVDWYLVTEIAKCSNVSFKEDSYFTIGADGRISMGPVADFSAAFGVDGDGPEGFVTRSEGWMGRLFEDPYFVGLVADRFSELKAEKASWLSDLDAEFARLNLSLLSNERLWNRFGNSAASATVVQNAYSSELDALKLWIGERLDWLSVRFENEKAVAKSDVRTSNNVITSFAFSRSKNSKALLSDYSATITEDSIKLFVPYLAHFDMVADFSASQGAAVYVNGERQSSGSSSVNFRKPIEYKVVSSSGDVRTYKVHVYNSGLPVVYATTDGNRKINDKVTWIPQKFEVYHADGKLDYMGTTDSIRGRGNSTWSASDKKPYAVKLDHKSEILGILEHKRWCLMANYYDVTFFRNELANYLSKRYTSSYWSPSGYNVEFVLNGKHEGNYYLCEQVKNSGDRVSADFLVEVDRKANQTENQRGDIIGVKTSNHFFFKDPERNEMTDADFNRVKKLLDEFETVLYDDGRFLDPTNGYRKYVDLESFVDWLLIKELSKDYDGNMFTSCYFQVTEDNKLVMGPIWDFDLAFGGNPFETLMGGFGFGFGGAGGTNDYAWYNEPQDYYIAESDWFVRMFKDPEFIALFRRKVNNMVDHLDEIMDYIDENTQLLSLSASANKVGYSATGGGGFGGFGGFGGWGGWGGNTGGNTDAATEKSYPEKMEVLKKFVRERLLWMQGDLKTR